MSTFVSAQLAGALAHVDSQKRLLRRQCPLFGTKRELEPAGNDVREETESGPMLERASGEDRYLPTVKTGS